MLWLVRHSIESFDRVALDNNIILFHWRTLPDLSPYDTRAKLKDIFEKTFPDEKPGAIVSWYSQMWSFIHGIEIGQLVILTRQDSSRIAIGEVTGEYRFDRNVAGGPWHCRPVKWIERNLSRDRLPGDIRQSLSSQLTVCRIDRPSAEDRIKKILAKHEKQETPSASAEETTAVIDPEQAAEDEILEFLGQNFRDHELEQLVAAVLAAKGYIVNVTRPGRDGGADILAGKGDLGFDAPYIIVQVKSSDSQVDSKVMEKLSKGPRLLWCRKGLGCCLGWLR